MADPKRLYKVFISSTFIDNEERRKLVRDAITTEDMVWHGMEIFPAESSTAKKACLEHARKADLLVGIIAHRYGFIPDGDEKSITEMEYDAAKEAGKDCLMFQIDSSIPVNIEKDFDQGSDKWDKQGKLDKFKEKFADDQMGARFNEKTLRALVQKSLEKWRKNQEKAVVPEPPIPVAQPDPEPMENQDEEIENYRKKAESLNATLPVAGFATRLKVPIDIDDIYVPLRAMVDLRGVDEGKFYNAAHAEKHLGGGERNLEISLADAFKQSEQRGKKGLVILGDPGSGKTTHLKRILLYCLRKSPEELGLPAGMLPVFLPLRSLKSLDKGLDAFIQDQLANPHLNTRKGFGKRLLKRGNLLFLLDGLDEVADIKQRELVSNWIKDALLAHPSCRFVVTCRFAGYGDSVKMNEHFLEMHVKPMSTGQAEEFVRKWYGIVEKGLAMDLDQAGSIADEKAGKLIERLRQPDFRARRVFELIRNPLLLTNICLVHYRRNSLPKKRALLYKECIDVLLESWRGAKGLNVEISAQDGSRALQPAALWLHQEDGRVFARAEELESHLEPALKAVKWAKGSASDFLRIIRDDSGLLTGWDQENYGFMHLGFQEYLAAREIRRRAFNEPGVIRELASHFGESWWQEVSLLLLALEDPSLFEAFMREVVKLPEFAKNPSLVAACLDDTAETSPLPFVELLKKKAGRNKGLWKRQLAALRVLEQIDLEEVKKLTPVLANHPYSEIKNRVRGREKQKEQDVIITDPGGYELVKIPGGSFMMGSPENEKGRDDDEGPRHNVHVPDFYMGRYPVTNEEYSRFLKENAKVKEPEYWGDRQFNQPKQPVVGVNWDDAKLYAKWVGLRLPTEAEWEYACRAGTATRFYTGNTEEDLGKAGWYEDNSEARLHSVGEKEPNSFGLYDMHGNVWEWMEDDWHDDYNGAPQDGSVWIDGERGDWRVLRGGSWYDGAGYCRSAIRNDVGPGERYNVVGFRLSRSVSLGA
ncbi:MAG: SUMF1/EgtB/PvdO family nonheme iron enzyme [Desulfobacteraceae bacterium]|nr:SUMF1/EgtB/PvdO family nonheme iron enzyme [Desulfobacteraceae bacterium]